MHHINEFAFLASVILFLCLPIASAGTAGFFSKDWTYSAYGLIQPGALDAVGQIAYFGTNYDFGFGYTNYLYAVNITNGDLIWQYNTSLPVNYVSNFTYNNSTYIVAGTGGSISLPLQSYVFALGSARDGEKPSSFWNSTNLYYSVQSLGAAGSGVSNNEDVIAGLINGEVVRLFGNNGSSEWSYNCAGNITVQNNPDIVQLDNGSVAVGTSSVHTGQSYIYSFEKNGTLTWNYPLKINIPLHLIKRLGNLNEVVVAFGDVIDVRNGTTGAEIWSQLFNATQQVAPYNVTQLVTDLLCAEDYTGDGFPDIVAGTDGGFLMIINGQNGTLFKESTQISYTLSYIQYMYSYETGVPLLNKTLAVSIETSSYSYYIYGVNASDLMVENKFPVSESFATANLVSTANSTNYTGNLLFSAYNVVYFISGTDIVFSEFPSQVMLAVVILTLGISIVISRRHKSRIKSGTLALIDSAPLCND